MYQLNVTRGQLQRWILALESGQFVQCRGTLTEGNRFCALGVAEAVNEYRFLRDIPGDFKHTIMHLNDKLRLSFMEIAKWLRGQRFECIDDLPFPSVYETAKKEIEALKTLEEEFKEVLV